MKKCMALAVSMLISMPTLAAGEAWFESNKPVKCGPFREIIQLVTGSPFLEQPLWIGQSGTDVTQFALFRNPDTNTWTLVQYGREMGCVLGMGKGEKTHEYNSNFQVPKPANP